MLKTLILVSLIFTSYIVGASETKEALQTYEKERLKSLISFVKLGYGDIISNSDFRSLDFTTECLNSDEAIAVLKLVKNYNAFQGQKVATSIEKFRGIVSCYKFGRAGSPLLVIEFPYWTHQIEQTERGKRGERISDNEFKENLKKFRSVFENTLFADEFGFKTPDSRDIYFWWD
ncbi:MAG: hypothetical protein ABJH06_01125 [Paraglaciecola sp.]|uniref:hypothetical protein n=1 Tax=Paraglaciecola sp. TaxID=1920173 RepID=UPI003298A585